MLNKDIVLFLCDFETTGVDPKMDYPIEVAGFFLDNQLNIIDAYQSFIGWKHLIESGAEDWIDEYKNAYNVHRIDFLDYKRFSTDVDLVRKAIGDRCKVFQNLNKKVILTSDNSYFEYAFMKKLFKGENKSNWWPFHYNSYDTDLLLNITGVGDPKPAHRAMRDIGRLYKNLIIASEKIKKE